MTRTTGYSQKLKELRLRRLQQEQVSGGVPAQRGRGAPGDPGCLSKVQVSHTRDVFSRRLQETAGPQAAAAPAQQEEVAQQPATLEAAEDTPAQQAPPDK